MARQRISNLSVPYLLTLPAVTFIAVFFIVPIYALVKTSFLTSNGSFTLALYRTVLSDPYSWWLLWRTFWISAVVTLICFVLAFPVAVFVRRLSAGWQSLIVFLLLSPLLTSVVVRTLGWVVLLGPRGLINEGLAQLGYSPLPLMYNDFAIIIGLVHVFMGYMVLAMLTSVGKIDENLLLAANNLGAPQPVAVMLIVLPLALPGAIAGSLLVFSMAASAYATPLLLGGTGSRVTAIEIYDLAITYLQWPEAAAYACLLFILIAATVAAGTFIAESGRRKIIFR